MNTLSIALVAVAAVMAAAVAMVSTSPVEAQQPPINHAAQCRSFTSYLMRVDGNTIKISPTHAARNTQPSGVEVVILDEHLNRVPGPVSVTWTYVTTSTDATLPRQQCAEIGVWVGVFTLPGNWHSVGVRWEDQGLSEVETNESYRRPAAPVNTGPPGTVHVAQPTTVEDLGIEQPAAEWSCSWAGGAAAIRIIYQGRVYWERGPQNAAERRGARDRRRGLLIGSDARALLVG